MVEQDKYLDSIPIVTVREDAGDPEKDRVFGVPNLRFRPGDAYRPGQGAKREHKRKTCRKTQ